MNNEPDNQEDLSKEIVNALRHQLCAVKHRVDQRFHTLRNQLANPIIEFMKESNQYSGLIPIVVGSSIATRDEYDSVKEFLKPLYEQTLKLEQRRFMQKFGTAILEEDHKA